ncbi:hypothetical protein N0V82_006683 [Gnomoniopsis sp. IMI 355080]|nr:hypothetical protein N0V82_006683 [Gnomoniopsis sp. IMI 355080]
MATLKLTTTHPFLTTMIPLAILALATIIAFILAIHSNYTSLASLWTPCTGAGAAAGGCFHQLLSRPLPTPLCFAIHFFQAAHATTSARIEQAVITSFLAGLATITAVESARVTRRADAAVVVVARGDGEKEEEKEWGKNERPRRMGEVTSRAVIANLTIPWLLYSLALGALAWQGIIIPAFLYRRRHQFEEAPDTEEDPHAPATIPLSVALGLFLPATIMLLHPTAPLPIILFLLFPIWVTLTHHLLRPLTSHLLTLPKNKILLYAPPIIASTLAHIAFLLYLLTTTTLSSSLPQVAATADDSRSAAHAALLLLELDHVAIFLAALYWIHLEAGAHGVLTTLATTIALGPGAGVCVGWAYRGGKKPMERQKSGKATGSFFGGLPA